MNPLVVVELGLEVEVVYYLSEDSATFMVMLGLFWGKSPKG
jgi:hypothetical protein